MPHKIRPYYHNGRFYFDKQHKPESLIGESLPSLLAAMWANRKRRHIERHKWVCQDVPIERVDSCAITWLGHATFLIQIGGINILTDPIFGDVSRFFRRMLPCGIAPKQLPSIDVVLISHNHLDHMDKASLHIVRERNPDVSVFVPHGDGAWFSGRGFSTVSEHTWWQDQKITGLDGKELLFHFVPAAHWSQRGILDKNRSLWGGWVISWQGRTIYFAGDTAYGHHFASIAKEFPSIDIALMPIGPIEPEKMRKTHISPEEAIEAFRELNARHFISMHWGTFPFGSDFFDEPMRRLSQRWEQLKKQLVQKELHRAKIGQRLHFG